MPNPHTFTGDPIELFLSVVILITLSEKAQLKDIILAYSTK